MEGAGSFLPFLLKIISVLKVFKVFKAIKDNNANLLPYSLYSSLPFLLYLLPPFFPYIIICPLTSLTSHNFFNSLIQTHKNSIPPNFG